MQLQVRVAELTHPVCCSGCQAVANLILNGGLDEFYKFRDSRLTIPGQLEPEDEEHLALYNRSDLLSDLAETKNQDSRRIELLIEGITCAACVWLIEQYVKKLGGVVEFWINLSTHRAELIWRQTATPLSDILKAIQTIGFKATPYKVGAEEIQLRDQQRQMLVRLGVAGIGMMQNMMLAVPMYFGLLEDSQNFIDLFRYISLLVAFPVVFYAAQPFFQAAWRDLKVKHLTMDVPVSLAIGGAFLASAWVTLAGGEEVYFESVCMFTFFLLLGRYLESRARASSARSNNLLRSKTPSFVRLLADENSEKGELIPVQDLQPGQLIELQPGNLIPVDGIIESGETDVNEAAITGEFAPQKRRPGQQLLSGSVIIDNKVILRVTAIGNDSHLATINRLVDRAVQEKPKISLMADRVASYFVAGVLIVAAVVALVWSQLEPSRAFDITLAVLVVTCPCALSLATPTALTAATTALRQAGFVITRGHTLETLSKTNHFVFDKTGTLTHGDLQLEEINNLSNLSEQEILAIAGALEWYSRHPIAQTLKPFANRPAEDIEHLSGQGVSGMIDGREYRLGKQRFALEQPEVTEPTGNTALTIYLSRDSHLLAELRLSDSLRTEAPELITELDGLGVKSSILSGDSSGQVETVARQLCIGRFKKDQSPQQKLETLKASQSEGDILAMVGDGINDVPVMAGADLSIAMNNASDLTQLQADALLLSGNLKTLSYAFDKAQRTSRIIRQNICWSVGYNLIALPLAAIGLVPPYAAAIGMSSSSLLVVFNALRLNRRPATEIIS